MRAAERGSMQRRSCSGVQSNRFERNAALHDLQASRRPCVWLAVVPAIMQVSQHAQLSNCCDSQCDSQRWPQATRDTKLTKYRSCRVEVAFWPRSKDMSPTSHGWPGVQRKLSLSLHGGQRACHAHNNLGRRHIWLCCIAMAGGEKK